MTLFGSGTLGVAREGCGVCSAFSIWFGSRLKSAGFAGALAAGRFLIGSSCCCLSASGFHLDPLHRERPGRRPVEGGDRHRGNLVPAHGPRRDEMDHQRDPQRAKNPALLQALGVNMNSEGRHDLYRLLQPALHSNGFANQASPAADRAGRSRSFFTRSSRPLTNLPDSAVENFLAISIASLIETTGGISGRKSIS